jgi:hypothetical protein
VVPGADSDVDRDFYWMRMRIQVAKIMQINADPDPQHWLSNGVSLSIHDFPPIDPGCQEP